MKRNTVIIIILMALTFGVLGCTGRVRTAPYPPGPGLSVGITYFYDSLSPWGTWYELAPYGWVWSPFDVSGRWRPYTNGYWVYTDWGWTWVSDYPWGWGPFHYGRWALHGGRWAWIPGSVWGPAWVAWRHRPGWVGWAALPPQAEWRERRGLDFGRADPDSIVRPEWYSFVEERRLTDRRLNRYIAPDNRNPELFRDSRHLTGYSDVDNRVVNRGVDVDQFERDTGERVVRRRVVEGDNSTARGDQVKGSEVRVFKPKVDNRPPDRTPRSVEGATRPSPPADLDKRQEKERRKLETQQEKERRKLEKQQQKERKKPPAGVSPPDLQNRHTVERRSIEDRQRTDRENLNRKQEAERKSRADSSKSSSKGTKRSEPKPRKKPPE